MKPKRTGKPHSKKRAEQPAPVVSSRKEKLIVSLSLAGMALVLVLAASFAGMIQQQKALSGQLAKWKSRYHLTDEQCSKIKAIELRFHGNGNPFTSRDSGTPEENESHYLEISRTMRPEDASRFLEDMRRKERH